MDKQMFENIMDLIVTADTTHTKWVDFFYDNGRGYLEDVGGTSDLVAGLTKLLEAEFETDLISYWLVELEAGVVKVDSVWAADGSVIKLRDLDELWTAIQPTAISEADKLIHATRRGLKWLVFENHWVSETATYRHRLLETDKGTFELGLIKATELEVAIELGKIEGYGSGFENDFTLDDLMSFYGVMGIGVDVDEYKDKCDQCYRKVQSRIFYRPIAGVWVWLCKVCWAIYDY